MSRLGNLREVDPSVPRPITVQIYDPQLVTADLSRARFVPSLDPETQIPLLRQLTLPQVILRVPRLTKQRTLSVRDRQDLSIRLTT